MTRRIVFTIAILATACSSSATTPEIEVGGETLDVEAFEAAVSAMTDCETALETPVDPQFEGCLDGETINVPLIIGCENSEDVFSLTVNDVTYYASAGELFDDQELTLTEICG